MRALCGWKGTKNTEGVGYDRAGKICLLSGAPGLEDAQGAEGSEAIGHLGGNKGTALLIKQKTQWVMKKANAPDTPKEKDMKKAKGTRNPLHPPCRGDASAFRAAGPVSGRPYCAAALGDRTRNKAKKTSRKESLFVVCFARIALWPLPGTRSTEGYNA